MNSNPYSAFVNNELRFQNFGLPYGSETLNSNQNKTGACVQVPINGKSSSYFPDALRRTAKQPQAVEVSSALVTTHGVAAAAVAVVVVFTITDGGGSVAWFGILSGRILGNGFATSQPE